MKLSNTVISIIIVAVVLVSAAAVGLLIHRAQVGDSLSRPQVGTAPNEQMPPEAAMAQRESGKKLTEEELARRARLKERRMQALEQMQSMTEEEKEQFRQQVRQQFSSQRPRRPEPRDLSPEERERILRKWQSMAERQRAAAQAPVPAETAAGASPNDTTNVEQRKEEADSGSGGAEER